jgi:hypothetical protein
VELDGDRIVLRFGSASTRESVAPGGQLSRQPTTTSDGTVSSHRSKIQSSKKNTTRRRLLAFSRALLNPSVFGIRSTIELRASTDYEAAMWLQAMYNRPLEGEYDDK